MIGVNCHFDPFVSLETLKLMKSALDAEGLSPYLMCQPLAYHTPDAGKQGFIDLPEFPFGLETRLCARLVFSLLNSSDSRYSDTPFIIDEIDFSGHLSTCSTNVLL